MVFPCIKVCDIDTTIEWYCHFLEFQCVYKSAIKSPDFAILEYDDDLKIYLQKDPEKQSYAANVLVIETDNLEKSLQSVIDRGVILFKDIGPGVFGGRDFVVKDYEDNKIIYRSSV